MQAHDLASPLLQRAAVAAEVELTVQPRRRLIRHQPQRPPSIRRIGGAEPRGMAGAIGIAEAGDLLREDLDLPARRRQRMLDGILVEGAQQAAVVRHRGQGELAELPERIEIRRRQAAVGERLPRRAVEVPEPLSRAAALGEGLRATQPLRERREDRVIVARLAVGLGDLVHGDHERVGRSGADILALQRHGRGQDDVGVARRGGPGDLVHHEGIDARERPAQPVQVLVMVEGIAARPIDQPDVGIGEPLAVVVEASAGIEQHVGDARDRNEVANAVLALRQRRRHDRGVPPARVCERAQRIAIAAAREPDLAEHRRQHHRHPDRLLAMLGALQRVRGDHQHALARQATREGRDRVGADAANSRGPCRRLGLPVGAAHEVVLEDGPARAIALQEGGIVPSLRYQRMRHPQHQRGVGTRQ